MPDVRGKKIVIFGDSLSAGSGSPGAEMGGQLEKLGAASVQINAKIGRSANSFWKNERAALIVDDIADFGADLVIIELGTNDLGLNMTVDHVQMQRIHDALSAHGAEVWAFGPPAFESRMGLDEQGAQVATMMVSVFGARFLDLRRLTRDMLTIQKGRAADGVHFTSAGGALLGKRMADELVAASSSSILFWAPVLALLAYAIFR
jgi:lysophospholipase L1-like esterase